MALAVADPERAVGPPGLRPDHRRLAVVLVAVLVAAPLTLATAVSEWRYQSPLAELAFVPVVGLLLLAATTARYPYVRTVRLGLVDWVLAVPALLLVAVLEMWDLVQPGSYSWVLRLDALTVPLVAFAAVVLLFGVRAVVACWPALLFLGLSWPLPVAALLEVVTGPVTALTSRSVGLLLPLLPYADTVPAPQVGAAGSDLVVDVSAPGEHFLVQVSSACSGVGGALGFLVVGAGLLCLHDGRVRAKAAWLGAGLLVVLACNVARIVALVTVGAAFGEPAALEVFHPVAGLLLLNVALALMLVSAPRFGLRRRPLRPAPTDNPLHVRGGRQAGRSRLLVVRSVAVLLFAALLGVVNVEYAQTAPAYRNASLSTVRSLTASLDDSPAFGYQVRSLGEEGWSRQYFGANSRWLRYELTSAAATPAPTVWVDVLDTDSLGSLRAHSTLRCYQLHGQDVLARQRVTLPSGVNVDAYAVTMRGSVWHVVSWERPVQRGGRVAHERVTLMASAAPGDYGAGLDPGAAGQRSSLRGRLLAGVNAMRPGVDPNPGLRANLLGLAEAVESAQLAGQEGVQ